MDRIKKVNPAINAVVCDAFATAEQQGEVADQAIRRGSVNWSHQPLWGVPETIKDAFDGDVRVPKSGGNRPRPSGSAVIDAIERLAIARASICSSPRQIPGDAIFLYVFLAAVSDQQGLSTYGDATMAVRLRTREEDVVAAHDRLVIDDLVAYLLLPRRYPLAHNAFCTLMNLSQVMSTQKAKCSSSKPRAASIVASMVSATAGHRGCTGGSCQSGSGHPGRWAVRPTASRMRWLDRAVT